MALGESENTVIHLVSAYVVALITAIEMAMSSVSVLDALPATSTSLYNRPPTHKWYAAVDCLVLSKGTEPSQVTTTSSGEDVAMSKASWILSRWTLRVSSSMGTAML